MSGAVGESLIGEVGTHPDFASVVGRTTIAATLGGLSAKATGGDFQMGAYQAAMVHLFNKEAETLWDSIKNGFNAKVGPGFGYRAKVKAGPIKAGGGFVAGSGGVKLNGDELGVWGKSTADAEFSIGNYGGRAYLWDIDVDQSSINNVDILNTTGASWDWSIGINATVTPYSFSIEYNFEPVGKHLYNNYLKEYLE